MPISHVPVRHRLGGLVLAAAGCLVLCAGCASTRGQASIQDESKVSQLQVGKSTTKDVQDILGTPTSTMRHEGELAWVYVSTNIHATAFIPFVNMAGNTVDSKNLTVTFDSKGVIKSIDRGEMHN